MSYKKSAKACYYINSFKTMTRNLRSGSISKEHAKDFLRMLNNNYIAVGGVMRYY